MYRLFEISVRSIIVADVGVNVGSVMRARAKFEGFQFTPKSFSSFRLCFIVLIKNQGLSNALT